MVISILNLFLLFAYIHFYSICFHKNQKTSIETLLPIFIVGTLMSVNVIILFLLNYLGMQIELLHIINLFLIYTSIISLFGFSCHYTSKKNNVIIRILASLLAVFAAYYSFYYYNSINANSSSSLLLVSESTKIVSYGFILPLLGIIVFIGRAFYKKENIEKIKFVLMSIVFIFVLCSYVFLYFFQDMFQAAQYLFSLLIYIIVFSIYRISLLDNVPNQKYIFFTIKTFFQTYVFFGFVAAFLFVITTYYIISYIWLLYVAIFCALALFYIQFNVRNNVKGIIEKESGCAKLTHFFTVVDYTKSSKALSYSFNMMLMNVFDASTVELYILNGDNLSIVHSSRDFYLPKIAVSDPLFSKLSNAEVVILTKEIIEENKRIGNMREEILHFLTTLDSHTCVLVMAEGRLIGVISLGQKNRSIHYSDADLELLNSFAPNFFVFCFYVMTGFKESLMGVIQREIHYSGQITEAINKNIDVMTKTNVEIGMLSKSIRNLGGDFIDSIRLTDTRHMFVVGDVSGRGLNASMCMIILKSFIRTFLQESSDFIGLLVKLNSFIKNNLPRGIFFAGTFMILDTSENILYYVNCGVPAIFLYTQSYNNVIEIQGKGRVLGFVDDLSDMLSVKKIDLHPGDIVLTCSDGVTESVSLRGEEYGKKRIESVLLENTLFPSQSICTFLYNDLQKFTAKGITDDVSVFTLKLLE